MASLKDFNEVKVLGLMLLLRLGQLSPISVIPRLDEVAESLKAIMKDVEVKDDTVKQDLERKGESRASLTSCDSGVSSFCFPWIAGGCRVDFSLANLIPL